MKRSIAFVVVVLAGCWTTPTPGPSPFGGTWTAIRAPGVSVESKLEAPRFQFTNDGKTLNGWTNCTGFTAPVAVSGRTFSIGPIAIGESVPCTARDRAIEAAVVAALRDATEISGGLPGDRLLLQGPNGELVLAQPMPDFAAENA